MKILIVDNVHGKQRSPLLEAINYLSNHHFYGAENARDAWDMLNSRRYDAILVDVSEDVAIRGLDILSEAVAREFPNIARICWSASLFSYDTTKLKEQYHHLVDKGLKPTTLIEQIESAVNSRGGD